MVSILSAARIVRSKVASSSSFGQLPLRVLPHFFLPDFFQRPASVHVERLGNAKVRSI